MKWLLAIVLIVQPTVGLAQPLWTADKGKVEIDQDVLDDVLIRVTRHVTLPLADRDLRVEIVDVEAPNLGVTSVRGLIDENPDSFFLACRTETGATVAFFQPGDGTAYRLDHTGGHLAVRAVDYEALGSCGGALRGEPAGPGGEAVPPGSAPPRSEPGLPRDLADDGSRHDILIGYTTAAEEYVGGWDYIRAEAQLAVDAANLTYDNSLIGADMRLVHVMSVDYDEGSTLDMELDLQRLANPDDGHMNPVPLMRNSVGADFVSLLVDGRIFDEEVPTCGVGYVMQDDQIVPEFEILAYSVVAVQCATDIWTLAHEVGHNRGCAHNRTNASVWGAYSYAFGYRFDGDSGAGHRTVMAYDHFLGGYERIPYFSNPDISYDGHTIGVPVGDDYEAHNALVHDNTAVLCAGFRNERTFVQFGYGGVPSGLILAPYPSIIEAIWGSRESGTIAILNDRPEFYGVLEDTRTYVHVGDGSTVLGGP